MHYDLYQEFFWKSYVKLMRYCRILGVWKQISPPSTNLTYFHQLAFNSFIGMFFVPLCKYGCCLCSLSLYFSTDMYVKDIQSGICAKDGEPVVEKESAATALVDGKNLLGPVVGNFCMNLAIKKAKEAGIGWVVAHGESHFLRTPKEKLWYSYTGLQDICQRKCVRSMSDTVGFIL